MRVYFTFRPLRINNKLYTPKDLFKFGFSGLNIQYESIAWDQNKDGRVLAYFDFTEDADISIATDQKAAILEALQTYGCHEKTLESAKVFYEYMTDRTDVTIEGDQLIIP